MTIALWQRPLARVVQGIVKAGNGCWLDPSDMSTMFQDAAGTMPVTAVEQPVGLILDKSGNGYHATQSITASRPTLSARYNIALSTEDIRNYILFTAGARAVGAQTVSVDGTNDAAILAIVFSSTQGNIRQSPRVGKFSFSCELRKTTGSPINSVAFNLDQGDCAVSAISIPTGELTLTDQWVKYTGAVNVTYTGTIWRLWVRRTGTAPSGSFDIRNIHINEGPTLLPYQRVNTATDYDTDPRYFPKYLRFDAVDDYLNLPFMNLYGGGAASVICARDAVSQVTDTYIISERSTIDIDPKYFPSRQLASAGNMDTYISDDVGAVILDTAGSPFGGAANAVIRSIVDSGNNLKLFKNGVLAANDNYTRSGTLTLNNTTIGASVSTTTSNYASMKLYWLIVTKSALTDAQRVRCERFLARKAGVML